MLPPNDAKSQEALAEAYMRLVFASALKDQKKGDPFVERLLLCKREMEAIRASGAPAPFADYCEKALVKEADTYFIGTPAALTIQDLHQISGYDFKAQGRKWEKLTLLGRIAELDNETGSKSFPEIRQKIIESDQEMKKACLKIMRERRVEIQESDKAQHGAKMDIVYHMILLEEQVSAEIRGKRKLVRGNLDHMASKIYREFSDTNKEVTYHEELVTDIHLLRINGSYAASQDTEGIYSCAVTEKYLLDQIEYIAEDFEDGGRKVQDLFENKEVLEAARMLGSTSGTAKAFTEKLYPCLADLSSDWRRRYGVQKKLSQMDITGIIVSILAAALGAGLQVFVFYNFDKVNAAGTLILPIAAFILTGIGVIGSTAMVISLLSRDMENRTFFPAFIICLLMGALLSYQYYYRWDAKIGNNDEESAGLRETYNELQKELTALKDTLAEETSAKKRLELEKDDAIRQEEALRGENADAGIFIEGLEYLKESLQDSISEKEGTWSVYVKCPARDEYLLIDAGSSPSADGVREWFSGSSGSYDPGAAYSRHTRDTGEGFYTTPEDCALRMEEYVRDGDSLEESGNHIFCMPDENSYAAAFESGNRIDEGSFIKITDGPHYYIWISGSDLPEGADAKKTVTALSEIVYDYLRTGNYSGQAEESDDV